MSCNDLIQMLDILRADLSLALLDSWEWRYVISRPVSSASPEGVLKMVALVVSDELHWGERKGGRGGIGAKTTRGNVADTVARLGELSASEGSLLNTEGVSKMTIQLLEINYSLQNCKVRIV